MDEVGAGCLAGPVVAAAYVYRVSAPWCAEPLPVRVYDSKRLSEIRRGESAAHLQRSDVELCAHAIVEVSHSRIDEINILWARMEAMWLAFQQAHNKMSESLGRDNFLWRAFVDGNRLPRECAAWTSSHAPFACPEFQSRMPSSPFRTVIKGDSQIFAIAAASIIAKEYRDRLMAELGELPAYSAYQWGRNVGYPTPEHQAAIREVGLSDLHRRTFQASL